MKGGRLGQNYPGALSFMSQLRERLSWGAFRKVFGKRTFQDPWVLYEKLKTLKKNEAMCRRMLFTSNKKMYFHTKNGILSAKRILTLPHPC